MKLFRYLPWESALKTLENQNLRFGRISQLNDPFEVLPAIPSTPSDGIKWDWYSTMMREELNDRWGFLCFSEDSTLLSPIMWSHYADHHKGAALGFDIISEDGRKYLEPLNHDESIKLPQLREVRCAKSQRDNDRVEVPEIEEIILQDDQREISRLIQKMLGNRAEALITQKAFGWNYEREWRCVCPFSNE